MHSVVRGDTAYSACQQTRERRARCQAFDTHSGIWLIVREDWRTARLIGIAIQLNLPLQLVGTCLQTNLRIEKGSNIEKFMTSCICGC